MNPNIDQEGREAAEGRALGAMDEADFLRRQAERCRWLAARIDSSDVSDSLRGMADEYDARAAALDRGEPPPPAEPA